MKNVFKLTNKYLILLTPLLLYSLVSSVYMTASAIGGKLASIILATVIFFLMTGAFISGWFYMIKLAVQDNSNNEPNSLLKEFPAGVGEYFLPALGAIFNILLFAIALLVLSYKFGMYFIGNIGVSSETLLKAFESVATLKLFISSLTAEQLIRINNWNFLVMTTMATICFLVILYLPTLFYKEKNPFKSFLLSFKSLFSKKFFKTLGLYLLIYFVNLAISILSAIFTGNIFMHFLVTLLNFYYITLACVGVFYYYFKNFVESNLGQNIDIEV